MLGGYVYFNIQVGYMYVDSFDVYIGYEYECFFFGLGFIYRVGMNNDWHVLMRSWVWVWMFKNMIPIGIIYALNKYITKSQNIQIHSILTTSTMVTIHLDWKLLRTNVVAWKKV